MVFKRTRSVAVSCLALIGAATVGYVAFVHMNRSDTLKDTVGTVERNLEQATMTPGNYAVQLELFHLPLSILKQLRNSRLLPSVHTVLIRSSIIRLGQELVAVQQPEFISQHNEMSKPLTMIGVAT